jgi:uncharacterized SAM-binding protein YcdF (DUF218 family)
MILIFFSFFLNPIIWLLSLLMITLFIKNSGRKKKFLVAAGFILLFFSNTFIFDRFMNAWEVKPVPEESVTNIGAAVLLTGMTAYDPRNERLEFNDRTDRLMQALKLYHIGKIKTILLCGGNTGNVVADSVDLFQLKSFMIKLKIDSSDIIPDYKSTTTHENAIAAKFILNSKKLSGKILLVTSGYHMRRAAACFIKEKINILPYSTDRYGGPVKFDFDYLIIPSAETFFNWEKLIHEWMGCIWYKIMGFI